MHFIPTFGKSQQLRFFIDIFSPILFSCRRAQKDTFVHSSKLGKLVCFCVPKKEAKGSEGGKTQGPFINHSDGQELGP